VQSCGSEVQSCGSKPHRRSCGTGTLRLKTAQLELRNPNCEAPNCKNEVDWLGWSPPNTEWQSRSAVDRHAIARIQLVGAFPSG